MLILRADLKEIVSLTSTEFIRPLILHKNSFIASIMHKGSPSLISDISLQLSTIELGEIRISLVIDLHIKVPNF